MFLEGLRTRVANLLLGRRDAALPVPTTRPSSGGFLNLIDLHNFDLRPIPTKAEQLDNYVLWVYACVQKISQDLRANPRALWLKTGTRREDWTPIPDEKVSPIFVKPNLRQTWGMFIEQRNQHKDITGEAWWHFISNTPGGKPIGLELIQPDWVGEPIYNSERTAIDKWWVTVPGMAAKPYDARDLILDFYPDPKDQTRGASPVEAFALAHHLDLYLRAYGLKMVRDGALISQYISSESISTPDQADIAEARVMKRYRMPGRVPVFGSGTTLHNVGLPLKDLGFLQMLKPTMDMVLAIYGVPRSKFGLTEGAGDVNQKVADKSYQENAELPRLQTFDEIVNDVVMPRIYGDESKTIVYESESPVEVDREFILKKASEKFKAGASTVNMYNQEIGDEEIGPDGDVYFIPAGVRVVTSLKEAAEQDAMEPEPEPAPDPANPAPVEAPPEDGEDETERMLTAAAKRLASLMTSKVDALKLELRTARRKNAKLEYEKTQDRHERVAQKKLRGLFDKEKKSVKSSVAKNLVVPDTNPNNAARSFKVSKRDWLDDALAKYFDDWRSLLGTTTFAGSEAGWVLLQQEVVGALAFKQFEQKAREFAAHHAGERVTDISTFTEQRLRDAIADGIETGKSVTEIAATVGDIYDDWKGFRSETIARTETASSINWGRRQGAIESSRRLGMDIRRSWLSVHDDRTRPDHDAADGDDRNQDIGLDDFYIVGGVELAQPGDPNGPAEQIINCRCTETYRDVEAS